MTLSLLQLLKAMQPRWMGRIVWVYWRLWWVDRRLQLLAVRVLQDPLPAVLPPLSAQLQQEIDRRVALIAWVARRHPCQPRCLHRSLVLYLWLRRRGVPARLHIGWEAIGHAWVSYGDAVLNDRPQVVQSVLVPAAPARVPAQLDTKNRPENQGDRETQPTKP